MKRAVIFMIILAAMLLACREEGTREVGKDADEYGYQVTVHCSNGMTLHGWASSKEDIPEVKRQLKAACAVYD